MDRKGLLGALGGSLPDQLAAELVDEFLLIRRDTATETFGGSSPGKFVETVVQVLQQLETGSYDASPRVDEYLRGLESRKSSLEDGLRICASRVARSMYALRSKRSIIHKGSVDPNVYDLNYLHASAQWIMAELVRSISGLSMKAAGQVIGMIQAPIGGLVEDFPSRKLVLTAGSVREELLILLHSHYPEAASRRNIYESLDRRSEDSVRKALKKLWTERLIEGNSDTGYVLTRRGTLVAAEVIKQFL